MTDVIAHRGASRAARENTIDAFRRAVEMGVDGVELDVRRSADGVLVVHHDPVVGGRTIVETAAADLPGHVPTLAAALDACAGVVVNIEIKNGRTERGFDPARRVAAALVELLAARPEPATTWLVSSFDMATIDRCRELAPDFRTAFLTMSLDEATIERVARHGHGAVHPWVRTLRAAAIRRGHEAGLRVNTWTCNAPRRAVELAGWGIDGIITDDPVVILRALDAARRA